MEYPYGGYHSPRYRGECSSALLELQNQWLSLQNPEHCLNPRSHIPCQRDLHQLSAWPKVVCPLCKLTDQCKFERGSLHLLSAVLVQLAQVAFPFFSWLLVLPCKGIRVLHVPLQALSVTMVFTARGISHHALQGLNSNSASTVHVCECCQALSAQYLKGPGPCARPALLACFPSAVPALQARTSSWNPGLLISCRTSSKVRGWPKVK